MWIYIILPEVRPFLPNLSMAHWELRGAWRSAARSSLSLGTAGEDRLAWPS